MTFLSFFLSSGIVVKDGVRQSMVSDLHTGYVGIEGSIFQAVASAVAESTVVEW